MRMFPGFISLYRSKDTGKVSLYFFPGLTDDGKPIYMALDLKSLNYEYVFTKLDDNAVVYTFNNIDITTVTANLVNKKTGATTTHTIKLDINRTK